MSDASIPDDPPTEPETPSARRANVAALPKSPYIVRPVPVGTLAADTIAHITPAGAKAVRARGVGIMALYALTVTVADLDAVLGEGMGVFFVMYSDAPGYAPSAELGARHANDNVARLRACHVPPGVTLVVDLEEMGGQPADRVAHANAAADAILSAADIPGAYIGSGVGLTSAELFALRVTRYWKSGSRVVDRYGQLAEPSCGWCAVQGWPFNQQIAGGPQVDFDLLFSDYAGRSMSAIYAA